MAGKITSIERVILSEEETNDLVRQKAAEGLLKLFEIVPKSEIVEFSPTGRAIDLSRLLEVIESIK